MGTVQGHEARIALTAKAIPRFHRSRPVLYALQENVNQELDRMQREGVIRPIEKDDWATPVVVIRKGDGTVRLCGDYKVTTNLYLDMRGYRMPNHQDLLTTSAGGRRFSRMVLKLVYQQTCVAPDSQHFLTINIPTRVYSRLIGCLSEYVQRLEFGIEPWTIFVRNFWCRLLFGRHISSW